MQGIPHAISHEWAVSEMTGKMRASKLKLSHEQHL